MLKHFILSAVVFCFPLSLDAQSFRFEERDDKQLALLEGDKPVLVYRYDMVGHENVPEKERRRTAGCYVHPLCGLGGETLTDNAPPDHYHHHGVFWTWPHVGVHQPNGSVRNYDLWTSNTDLKQHFVRWIGKRTTSESAVFEVENGWFVGMPEGGDKIMSETVKIIVHRTKTDPDGLKSRAVDFDFLWKPTDKPVSLRGSEGKSYGGFTIRLKPYVPAAELEKNPNALSRRNDVNTITVPAGVAESDLPETPLAWADYTSRFDGREERSGLAIFVSKTHPDFPPTWLTRYYGPLCVGWPGVDGKKFEPGEEIRLRYRIWIHDGPVTVEQLEKAYETYNSEKIDEKPKQNLRTANRNRPFLRNLRNR